jgi:hypothetical protein
MTRLSRLPAFVQRGCMRSERRTPTLIQPALTHTHTLASTYRHDARRRQQTASETRPRRCLPQSRQRASIAPLRKETEARQWQRQDRPAGQNGHQLLQLEPAGAQPVRGDAREDDAGHGDAEGEQHRERPAMAAAPAARRLQRADAEACLPAD